MMINLVAVIGLGNIALRHRKNLKILFPDSIVIALSSRERVINEHIEYADSVASNLCELVNARPDFVIVASPATYHLQHASVLIEAGIPVLIEKPVTAELEDADKLAWLSKKFKTPIAVGYCLRYLPSSIKMKTLLDENFIGSIYNCFINAGQYLPDWRPNINYQQSVSASKNLGGGVLLELSHDIDYALWLLGDLNVEYAHLRKSSELDIDVEAIANVTLKSQFGTVCTIHLDFLQKQAQRCCSFVGSKGRLDWDLITNTISHHHTQGSDIIYADSNWDKNNMYLAMINDFILMINHHKNQCVEISQARKSIQLIKDIKRSAIDERNI